ncbi:MAG: thioredoxin [Alphaproteobacteria bacterium]
MSNVKSTSDAAFEADVLKSEKPVLVDFWAPWCGPCRAVAPVLEQLSESLGEAVEIVKVNIDENPETPTKYGVKGIPTLMIFKEGELAATKVGALSKAKLEEWVSEEV